MGTWFQDLQLEKPTLAAAYKITGQQDRQSLKNMVKALEMCPYLNTEEDNKRLEAAKYILRNSKSKVKAFA